MSEEIWKPNLRLIKRLAAQGVSEKNIAARCGKSLDLFREYRTDQSNGIHKAVEDGFSEAADKLSAIAYKKALAGNVHLIMFLMKAKFGYGDNDAEQETPTKLPSSISFTRATKKPKTEEED